MAYEVAKKKLTPAGSDPSQLNLGAVVVAGGLAGVAMWSVAIPPDVSLFPLNVMNRFLNCSLLGHQIPLTVGSSRNLYRIH